jgi:hypothetical protein
VRPLLIAAAILVACAGLIYLLLMSPYAFTILDKRGPSESVGESRRRGVYLFRYKVLNPDHYIDDSTEIHISEAWIERGWRVGTFYHQTIHEYEDGYLLCLRDSTLRTFEQLKSAPAPFFNGDFLTRCAHPRNHKYQSVFYLSPMRILSPMESSYGPPRERFDIPIVIGDFKKPDTVGTLHLVFEDGRPDTPR